MDRHDLAAVGEQRLVGGRRSRRPTAATSWATARRTGSRRRTLSRSAIRSVSRSVRSPPKFTYSETTPIEFPAAISGGRYAVESVTTAVRGIAGAAYASPAYTVGRGSLGGQRQATARGPAAGPLGGHAPRARDRARRRHVADGRRSSVRCRRRRASYDTSCRPPLRRMRRTRSVARRLRAMPRATLCLALPALRRAGRSPFLDSRHGKTLVTGGAGFIGSHVARALADRGDELRLTMPRLDEGREPRRPRLRDGQVRPPRPPPGAARAASDVDRVFHCAGLTSLRAADAERLFEVNVVGTRNLLEECLRAGVERVVYTSSVAAIGPAPVGGRADENQLFTAGKLGIPYVNSKHEAEVEALRLAAQGLPLVVRQPVRRVRRGRRLRQLDVDRPPLHARPDPGLRRRRRSTSSTSRTSRAGTCSPTSAARWASATSSATATTRSTACSPTSAACRASSRRRSSCRPRSRCGSRRRSRPRRAAPPITVDEVKSAGQWWTYRTTKAKRELGWKTSPHEDTIEATVNWYIDREGDRFKRSRRSQPIQYKLAAAMLGAGEEARLVTVLYRCPTPTNYLCACGKVARKLNAKGIDFDQVRVPYRKSGARRGRGPDEAALGPRAGARRGGHPRLEADRGVPRRASSAQAGSRCRAAGSKPAARRPRRRGPAPRARRRAARRRAASASSPDSYISMTMSQPPTSLPSTKSCGIVGQSEIAESSWRIRGSGRMSSAAYLTLERVERGGRAHREAAGRLVGGALHEEHHGVVPDRLLQERADLGVGHRVPPGVEVLRERAWIGPPTSSPNTS